jgi:hypothetical protein
MRHLPLLPTICAGAAAALALFAAAPPPAAARVKLVTLPERDRVELELSNPNATLVEEERTVSLLKGANQIDFSWANTAIDKSTILFRPLGAGERVRVISVAYPPNENSLVWQVYAEEAGPVKVRISYLLANLGRSFSYRAAASRDERTLELRNFIRVDNFSGEEYAGAGIWAGFGQRFEKQMGQNESKEMLERSFAGVPIKKTYTFDWWTNPPVPDEPDERYVPMHYVLRNDEKGKLGAFPLQAGKARVFQEDGHGGEAFLGEDWARFTPRDDELKLYLGLARDVVVRRKIARSERRQVRGNLFDQEIAVSYEIQNFKSEALTLDIEEDLNRLRDEICGARGIPAEWEIGKETSFRETSERKDEHTLLAHVALPAAGEKVEKITQTLVVTIKNVW